MTRPAPVVIVGTGLAGYGLARELRKLDAQTPLLLISADDGRSYSKPMLSTAFAKGQDAEALVMAEPGALAEQLNAEIRTHTRVTAIDPQARRLWLGNEPVDYRDLVLALGAECVRVPVDGDATGRILTINDLEDYARFRSALAGKQRVLILGAGLIGCEFANDLRLGGYQVDLVGLSEQPMPELLQPALGGALRDALQRLGVGLYLGRTLASLNPADDGLQALLSDGTRLSCDLVLSAVGLRPRVALANSAGLACGRGIRVDRRLQTSAEHVYALGDCAEVDGLNLLYVMPLMAGVRALARTLAGEPSEVRYGPMPVTVKTPACPLVVALPPPGHAGNWELHGEGPDWQALCRDADGKLLGYGLSGQAVQGRLALNRELPPLLD